MSPFVRLASVRLGDRLCAQSVLLVVLGVLTLTFSGLAGDRESELDFQTTRSLAHLSGGDLEGTPEAARLVLSEDQLWQPKPGQYRSTRPLGGPIASVPLYWAGSLFQAVLGDLEERHANSEPSRRSEYSAHLAVGWKNSLLVALTAWMVVLSSRRIGVGRRQAWLGGLTFVLTTFVWPAARGSSIDVQAGFFLFLAFHLLLRARERFERLLRPRRADLLFIGVALGMTLLTRPRIWPAILILLVATVVTVFSGYRRLARYALFLRKTWRLGHWVDTVWVFLPLLLALAVTAVANRARSGSIFGVPGELLPHASSDSVGDLILVLAAPGHGLLWLAPLVVLAPAGILLGLRRGARLWPLSAAFAVLPVLWAAHPPLAADVPWGFGPVRLVPALPFLWLGVALTLDRSMRLTWFRRLGYALCVLGVVTNLSGVLVDAATYQELVLELDETAGLEPPEVEAREGELFRTVHWWPRLAQPWVSWRVLRHRLAGQGEDFPVDHIFFSPSDAEVTPESPRNRGFRHMAWVDLRDRLATEPYPSVLVSLILVAVGCVLAIRGLDRALP